VSPEAKTMSNINAIGTAQTTNPLARRAASTQAEPAADQPQTTTPREDRVEISNAARRLDDADAPSRADLVSRVRQQIANDTYITPDKVDAAIDALAQRLG